MNYNVCASAPFGACRIVTISSSHTIKLPLCQYEGQEIPDFITNKATTGVKSHCSLLP